MLPAASRDAVSLADVLESCLAAVTGTPGRLALPEVDHAIVVLIDGLGEHALRARSGHARTLATAPASVLASGFPTTTAVALASLATGALPGAHGVVGYTALVPDRDRVVNQLTGWGPEMVPETWQPVTTVFERARAAGWDAVAIGPERYRESGFSRAVLRGADYWGARTIDDRIRAARQWLATSSRGIAYVYIPELDVAAHAHGGRSPEWTAALETADAGVRELAAALGSRDGMIVTGDHGVLDIEPGSHVLVDQVPGLLSGVRHLAGEPRCLQLHVESGVDPAQVLERWADHEGDRAWVASRADVVASSWWGEVGSAAAVRMGDVFVAAREPIAYYDSRTAGSSRGMTGQHGSLSSDELLVPLIGFGAFAAAV